MTPRHGEAFYDSLIWRHDPLALANLPPALPGSWAGAVQQEIQRNGLSSPLPVPGVPRPAVMNCAAITMIKDEADIIHANLAWLYRQGLRRFIVMDNLSTDATVTEIRRFVSGHAGADLVLLRDPIVAHFQAQKVTSMARLAVTRWPDLDWILPIDADEFCIPIDGFETLATVPGDIDALTVPKAIHFLDKAAVGADHTGNVFSRMPIRSGLFSVPPKIIARASLGLEIEQGNHKSLMPHGFPTRYAGGFAFGFYHREFQTRSFAQFLRKIRNGGAAILAARATGANVGGEHWMDWHALLIERGEAALHARYLVECHRASGDGFALDPFDPLA
jgi:hypothetical protein